jgi:hypothetical protein
MLKQNLADVPPDNGDHLPKLAPLMSKQASPPSP